MSGQGAAAVTDVRRRDAMAVLCLLALVATLVAATLIADRAYLPRHTGVRDLPWAAVSSAAYVGEPDNGHFNDKMCLVYPGQAYNSAAFRAGRLPSWNPLVFAGVPHAANPIFAVFYPPNWLLVWLPQLDGALAIAALHVLLAGLFMLMYLRAAGLSSGAALLGALGFAFSGWVAAHLQNTQLVAVVIWIPLGLWALERLFGQGKNGPGSFAALAVAVAMMWLAGFPQFAVLGCVALLVYAICGLLASRRHLLRRTAWLGAAAFTGLLLASAQLLPTMDLLQRSARGSRTVADLQDEHYRAGSWIGLAMPRTLGDPMAVGDWTRQGLCPELLGEGPQGKPPLVSNWSERTVYPGLAVLLLAGLGIVCSRRRTAISLLCMAGLGVAMACSTICIAIYGRLPGFGVGAPARAVLLLAVALPALAACGWQVLAARVGGRLGAVVSSLLLVIAAVVGVLAAVAFAADWYEGLRADLLMIVATSAVLGAMLVLHRRALLGRNALCVGVLMVATVDLLAFWVPVNLPVSKAGLYDDAPALRFLADNLGHDRFVRVSSTKSQAVGDRAALFHPQQGMLFGLRDAQGYGILVPQPYLELWRGLTGLWSRVGFVGVDAASADSSVLDVAAVRYLIAARPIPQLADWRVYPGAEVAGDLWIYRNPDSLPRARLVSRARVAGIEESRRLLRAGDFDVATEVLVDRLPQARQASPPTAHGVADPAASTVRWVRDEPEVLELSVDVTSASYLVVADAWAPGWQAVVVDGDGARREVPILRAMTCFRAVPVEPGDQRVEMVYRPASVRVGVTLSLAAVVAFGVLLLAWRRRRYLPISR